ncbi:MAG: CapA family protein [Lachnospiraceae bacterium]|nr:CapA family protein [Lachnospiraceae bacterium]
MQKKISLLLSVLLVVTVALAAGCVLYMKNRPTRQNAIESTQETEMISVTASETKTSVTEQIEETESGFETEAESEPVIAETETKEDEIVTITISAAGDVTLGTLHNHGYELSLTEVYDNHTPAYFFENVKPIFEADDMTLVNYEGVLTLSDERVEKKYNMKGDPEYVHILTEGDIEAVSFANNHRMDYGQQGSDDTVAAFESVGITYAYDTIVGYYETKGITIGYISFNEVYDGEAVEEFIRSGMEELKAAEVDLIIACGHWGKELHHYPQEYQTQLAHMCIDLGADLVVGHHPHVLQGVDIYNGKYIVYSLGNFCFGGNKNPKDKDSMIFQQTFTFVNGEHVQDDNIKIIPVRISSVSHINDYKPTPAQGDEAKNIIDRVNEYSAGFGLQFDYEGNILKEKE